MPESSSHPSKRAKIVPSKSSEDKHAGDVIIEKGHKIPQRLNRLQRSVVHNKQYLKGLNKSAAQLKREKKAEKQAGILAALMDAPVEIFCEIALYLSPLDLLNLSRVSRQLRNLILCKQNRNLWKACLSSIDLPPCPDDLNEPQYVSLVFDTDCNACGAPNVKSVYYELRLRLCKKCFKSNVIAASQILSRLKLDRCFKFLDTSDHSDVYKLIPYAGQISIRYFNNRKDFNIKDNKFYKPDLIDAVKEYTNLKTLEDKSNFAKQRLKRIGRILKHSALMQQWEEQKMLRRKSELSDLASVFYATVEDKLKELGYTDTDWSFNGIRNRDEYIAQWIKLTFQKKELTPRIWKTLAPKLEELIENYKSDLEEQRRQERYSVRRDEFRREYDRYVYDLNLAFGEKNFLPSSWDLTEEESVADFLRYDDNSRVITYDVFSSFLPEIVQIFYEIKLRVLAKHEDAIVNWRKENNREIPNIGGSKHIYLASSFFFSSSWSSYNDFFYFNSKFPIMVGEPTPTRRITEDSSRIHKLLVEISDGLLRNLGLPLNTTMDAVEEMGNCFVCCRCDVVLQKPMGWIELIKHIFKEKRSPVPTKTSLCGEDDIKYRNCHNLNHFDNLVRKLDEKEFQDLQEQQEAAKVEKKRCAICVALKIECPDMTVAQVKAHLKATHGKKACSGDIL